MALPDLSDRVAVVTGGSQGIGRGIAVVLGEARATIYVTGRSQARLERVPRRSANAAGAESPWFAITPMTAR